MLLLVTILLVVVAAVTLLIGIFSDELALIFISIGASALAAIVLAVLSQMSRKKGRATASDAKVPEPLPARQQSTPASEEVAQQAAATIAETGEPVVRTGDLAAVEPTTAVSADELAIADYDSLRVNEILPKLEGLDLDELEAIAQHEESRKNRTTVLNRIDTLMDQLEAAETTTTIPVTEISDELAEEAVASIEEIGEPVVAIDAGSAGAGSGAATDHGFPIPDYDSLSESELIPLLADLDADQLEAVADREEAGPNRDAVLDAIDDRLDILEGIVPAPATAAGSPAETEAIDAEEAADELPAEVAAPTRTRGPAKKATAKKAAAKKSPGRKVAAAPVAVTKATTAKKAPARVAKTTLEPPKKAPLATRAAKATSATRAVKATPAAKKAASATAAKKAPAKKATAAKKAAKR